MAEAKTLRETLKSISKKYGDNVVKMDFRLPYLPKVCILGKEVV